MKLSKIALATAAVAALASGSLFAGDINSSSVPLAVEVINSNTQIVRAPSVSYNFAGDIDARSNAQNFQLQYTLDKGTWSTSVVGLTLTPITLGAVGAVGAGMLNVNYVDGGNAPQGGAGAALGGFPALSTVAAFVTADRKTLVFNVTIPATNTNPFLLKQPIFTINAQAIGTTDNAGINGLLDVAGAAVASGAGTVACKPNLAEVNVTFAHSPTHNGSAVQQTVYPAGSEHLRPSASNKGPILSFAQNHGYEFTPAARVSQLDPLNLNRRLLNTAAAINFTATAPAAGTALLKSVNNFMNALPATTGIITRHYLGSASIKQVNTNYDLNYTNRYGDSTTTNPAVYLQAADISVAAPNTLVGLVEAKEVTAVLTFPAGALPVGTVIRAVDGTGAAITSAGAVVTTTAGQTVVTFKLVNAADIAAAGAVTPTPALNAVAGVTGGIHFFADFDGLNVISASAGPVAGGVFVKSPAGAGPAFNHEQDVPSCPNTLTGIGGGIKIDIRNYASAAKFNKAGDPQSVVRLINNSESQSATVIGQMIYADGTYGPYGTVVTLAPREVANFTNAQLEAKFITTPAASNPFGGNTVYTQTAGAAVSATAGKAGVGDRVRFSSENGTTLRVQSFMILGSTILDTSQAQGVDFENTANNRTPTTAVDAQPNSQDAINGIAK